MYHEMQVTMDITWDRVKRPLLAPGLGHFRHKPLKNLRFPHLQIKETTQKLRSLNKTMFIKMLCKLCYSILTKAWLFKIIVCPGIFKIKKVSNKYLRNIL